MRFFRRSLLSVVLFSFSLGFLLLLSVGCSTSTLRTRESGPARKNPLGNVPTCLRDSREELGRERREGAERSKPFFPQEQTTPAAQLSAPAAGQTSYLIVVDAGHGNPGNPGPRGPSGLKEADVNLDIGLRLRQLLESAGIKVLMTRDGPTTPLGNPERAELANQNNASLFFRIHSDSSRDPTEGGTRTLWYKPDSERAARIVQGAVVRELGLKDLGIRKQFLVGFQYAQVPAVLVEVAYISNPSEEKLLADPAFRQRAAQGMYDGIREYLEEINNLR